MRALTISANGGTDKLEFRTDVAEPEVTPGSVRVRIKAAALNQLDIFMLRGLPGVTLEAPWIMGADGAGVVDKVGAGVTSVVVGDTVVINPGISDGTCEFCLNGEQSECVQFRLLGEHLPGTLAEYVVVPERNVGRIPESTSMEIAAAYSLATLTAWRMVHTRAKVTADDQVLIWGIGGGVAQAALRICKQLGAKVWVTSGSDEKLEKARQLGADEVLNHRTMNVGKEIRSRTEKRGVSVVLDSVGQATWSGSLAALGRAGRLVTCGGTSGPIVETDVRRLFWNQWTIMGSTMGNHSEFDAVVNEFNEGRLQPVVDSVYELENGRAAFERMAAGEQFGKIVIRVSE
ncbi:MAG TPA: zinc-binding dehydrogenase [Gemmatimonadaceae bacterium]|nr:zinc-binding dehydrogenase [Gemmatimonadaceae bacterium]